MLVEHSGPRFYLLGALEATPEVLEHLLRDLTDEEADFRPDAARFTIREVAAHLADWDAIFLKRLQRTRDENEPFLRDIDEGQLSIENDYAGADVGEQLLLFRARRALLCDFANEVLIQQWQRFCQHQRVGRLTLEALVTLIPLHDAYHLRQIVEWRQMFAEK